MFVQILVLVLCALGVHPMTPQQAKMTMDIMKKYQSPPWTVVIDAAQIDTVAYTDADRKRIYINYALFRDAPRSLANVIHHEVMHAHGHEHNKIPGDIMSYAVTMNRFHNARICLRPCLLPCMS
jgi:hypothetical protein